MNGHLVAVEVGVETLTNQRVKPNGVTFHQCRFERLNTHPVQGRGPVQKNRVIFDHLFKNVPDLIGTTLKHLLGRFDRISDPLLFKPTDDERLEQLQSDFLRKTALVQTQFRTNHDDGTS